MQTQPPLEHIKDRVQIVDINRDHYFIDKFITTDIIKGRFLFKMEYKRCNDLLSSYLSISIPLSSRLSVCFSVSMDTVSRLP